MLFRCRRGNVEDAELVANVELLDLEGVSVLDFGAGAGSPSVTVAGSSFSNVVGMAVDGIFVDSVSSVGMLGTPTHTCEFPLPDISEASVVLSLTSVACGFRTTVSEDTGPA